MCVLPEQVRMQVELQGVSVFYEQIPALNDVSFTLPRGGMLLLTGPTGAGKTTVLRLLYREIRATRGKVWVDGVELSALPYREVLRLRRRMGIVFQDCRLVPSEDAYSNVLLPLLLRGMPRQEAHRRTLELFSELGISYLRHRLPQQLSGGEAQLVALARAVAHSPELLLADEVTGNLEPNSARMVVQFLQRVHAAGTTVIVATHAQEAIQALAPVALLVELRDGVLVSSSASVEL
jgi:cell division transport system ATP-binding protein